jgi:ribulose-5-phosphate 4-epimerase/fuculose-1-phosphate aldolase
VADSLDALRRAVALSCRILAMTGLVKETTGHVSARIPGRDEMFIRARGNDETGLLFTSEAEIVRVDFDGHGVDADAGLGTPNELPIHGEIYKARPAVASVVHAHPPGVLLCGIAGVELRPLFGGYDPSALRIALDGIPVFPRSITLHRPEDVWPMLEIMGDKSVCLMRGHGITVTGTSVEQATIRAIKMETLARVNWQAASRGAVPEISAEDVEAFNRPGRGKKRQSTEPVWRYYLQLLEQRGLLLHDPVLDVGLA